MRLGISYNSLIMALTLMLLINIPFVPQTMNNLFILSIEALYILLIRSISFRVVKQNKSILLFALTIVGCTFLNLGLSTRTANALVTAIRYILLFYSVTYFAKKKLLHNFISTFICFLSIMIFIADLSIVVTLFTKGISEHGGAYNSYIIGNKFTVSYYHMFFLGLYQVELMKWKKQEILGFCILSLASVIICYIIECNTGIIGCVIVILIRIISKFNNPLIRILAKPSVFCMVFISINYLFLGTGFLTTESFIVDLLRKFSHTSTILTGRYEMYIISIRAFLESPIIGYGINSTVVEDILTWGNPQNGLLKILLDYGIMGAIAFLSVCYHSLKTKNSTIIHNSIRYGLLSFLYSMSICSLVEININSLFIIACALYSATVKNDSLV